jgi:hypothetical protein
MTAKGPVYITVEWQEQGPLETPGSQLWREERMVCTPYDYPEILPCSNPNCEDGGFEIGDRVAELLGSGKVSDQNSLVCRNAIDNDRSKRCLHTIIYSITRVRPYQRNKSQKVTSGSATA